MPNINLYSNKLRNKSKKNERTFSVANKNLYFLRNSEIPQQIENEDYTALR